MLGCLTGSISGYACLRICSIASPFAAPWKVLRVFSAPRRPALAVLSISEMSNYLVWVPRITPHLNWWACVKCAIPRWKYKSLIITKSGWSGWLLSLAPRKGSAYVRWFACWQAGKVMIWTLAECISCFSTEHSNHSLVAAPASVSAWLLNWAELGWTWGRGDLRSPPLASQIDRHSSSWLPLVWLTAPVTM